MFNFRKKTYYKSGGKDDYDGRTRSQMNLQMITRPRRQISLLGIRISEEKGRMEMANQTCQMTGQTKSRKGGLNIAASFQGRRNPKKSGKRVLGKSMHLLRAPSFGSEYPVNSEKRWPSTEAKNIQQQQQQKHKKKKKEKKLYYFIESLGNHIKKVYDLPEDKLKLSNQTHLQSSNLKLSNSSFKEMKEWYKDNTWISKPLELELGSLIDLCGLLTENKNKSNPLGGGTGTLFEVAEFEDLLNSIKTFKDYGLRSETLDKLTKFSDLLRAYNSFIKPPNLTALGQQ